MWFVGGELQQQVFKSIFHCDIINSCVSTLLHDSVMSFDFSCMVEIEVGNVYN